MKKKVIVSSILTIALCLSLIAGSTFALFTSEDSINIAVTAGKVNVVATVGDLTLSSMGVEMTDTFENGGTAEYDEATGEIVLKSIVPGDKVEFDITVENNSDVTIQYRLTWSADGELMDALVATADGVAIVNGTTDWAEWKTTDEKTKVIPVSVELPVSVGNEYQEKSAIVSFKVEAVQGNAVVEEITSADQLYSLLEIGGTATLMSDVIIEDGVSLTVKEGKVVVLDLNGNTIEGTNTKDEGALIVNNGTLTILGDAESVITNTAVNGGAVIDNNGTLTLDGANIEGSPIGESGYPAYAVYSTGILTVEEGTSISSDRGALSLEGGKTVINGGSFTTTDAANAQNLTLHTVYAYGYGSELTINGGSFENNYTGVTGASVICPAGATITIYGGDFRDAVDDTSNFNNTANFQNYMGYGVPLSVYGGTYDDATVTKNVAKYYKASLNEETGIYEIVYADNVTAANDDESLDDAIKEGKDVVFLGSGNYIIPDSAQGKTLTIIGNGVDTVVATQDDGSYEGCDYSLDGATVTFEGITINTDSTTYTGYARLKATYNNCVINGTYTLYDNSVFNDCEFNVSGDVYNIWTWGAPNAEFNRCTFNSDGKAILLYGTANTNLTLNSCVFNDNGGLTDLKAAVEIGDDYGKSYTLTVNNTTVNGYEINDKGINTGSTLWANKNSMSQDKLNVVIDGVDVY